MQPGPPCLPAVTTPAVPASVLTVSASVAHGVVVRAAMPRERTAVVFLHCPCGAISAVQAEASSDNVLAVVAMSRNHCGGENNNVNDDDSFFCFGVFFKLIAFLHRRGSVCDRF